MKFKVSFALKIIIPYLAIAALFLIIFISALNGDHALVISLSAAGVAFSVLLGVIHFFWLRRPLYRIRDLLALLARGNMPGISASKAADATGELERNLEKHVGYLQSLTRFARAMAAGDFSGKFEKLSAEDEIGEALLLLKESLEASLKESESRRGEEENRTWTAHGLAKFSKLFREAEDDLQELSQELMRELVAYTEADVGVLFITNDSEDKAPELVLTGSYAFDREKFIRKAFEFGESLVGRAAVEKEVIHISDLPPDYMKIRSGLGEDVPSSIVLVPVMLDNHVLGVIELASLGEMPSYQIEFVRQLSDALATTLAKVKANLRNRQLFEQTKKQAEALSSQEKVFKQNLEKLEKAQIESSLREEKLMQEIERLKK